MFLPTDFLRPSHASPSRPRAGRRTRRRRPGIGMARVEARRAGLARGDGRPVLDHGIGLRWAPPSGTLGATLLPLDDVGLKGKGGHSVIHNSLFLLSIPYLCNVPFCRDDFLCLRFPRSSAEANQPHWQPL